MSVSVYDNVGKPASVKSVMFVDVDAIVERFAIEADEEDIMAKFASFWRAPEASEG